MTDLSSTAYPCLTAHEETLLERGYTLRDIERLRDKPRDKWTGLHEGISAPRREWWGLDRSWFKP